jgi:short-subunit dehydrogenase
MNKIALVTGASSGIGEVTAIRLAALGITTFAAARRTERMEHLKEHGIKVIKLDLTDEASIRECVATIESAGATIDILVNNAGYGSYGSIEEVPLSEARRQVEVNVFGLAAITQLVIPAMRRKRWGRIVNVSSIAGVQAWPYGGWYHATKFAVEGLSSALRQELSPFGVDVVLVRPGAIKTEWAGIAAQSLLDVSGHGPYAKAAMAIHKLFTGKTADKIAVDSSVIAEVIVKAVTAARPKAVYTAPLMARFMLAAGKLAGSDHRRDGVTRVMMGLPKSM